jgi:hypothetical protein
MFTTISEAKLITGKNVSQELIGRAQFVIESYIGKFETEISNSKDIEICKRAVAYQAAYMLNNEDVVFEQMSVSTTGINDAYTTFKDGDDHSPFVSPMAVMSCRMLSFVKSRSIVIGKNAKSLPSADWRTL